MEEENRLTCYKMQKLGQTIDACLRNQRERLEFSALPTSDLIPGQANDEEEEEEDDDDDDDEEDDDAKSLANDSFTTAASTLSLGDICKERTDDGWVSFLLHLKNLCEHTQGIPILVHSYYSTSFSCRARWNVSQASTPAR